MTTQALSGVAGQRNGLSYTLELVQQPIRARMCGFGDKDRRCITPPPCVRLIVQDVATGQVLDPAKVESNHFVLSCDLWDGDGAREVNCVRHSSTSPSISAAATTTYPPQFTPSSASAYTYTGQAAYGAPHPGTYNPAYYGQQPVGYPPNGQHPHSVPIMDPRSAPGGMHTRNLIGSLATAATKLYDTSNQLGVWFVLSDLSVRTEGTFRLKMNFTDLSDSGNPNSLTTANAPILSMTWSAPFQVFSAKKFPGVIASTALNKCFASQGVKIPIRKDETGGSLKRDFDDEDDESAVATSSTN